MKRFGIPLGILVPFAILVATIWFVVSTRVSEPPADQGPLFVFPAKNETNITKPPATMAEQVAARLLPTRPAGVKAATSILASFEQATTPTPTTLAAPLPTVTPTPDATATQATRRASALPLLLKQGDFVNGDAAYKGRGSATIYTALDGTYLLRFEDFRTSSGPDVHVLLSPNAVPTNRGSLGRYLDLGKIQHLSGPQTYTLPADFDPAKYKSVVIYCVPFRAIFATATLKEG